MKIPDTAEILLREWLYGPTENRPALANRTQEYLFNWTLGQMEKHGVLCECDPCIHGGPTRHPEHFMLIQCGSCRDAGVWSDGKPCRACSE